MREIPVGRDGLVALVDDADFETVSKYRWHPWTWQRANGSIDGPYAHAHVKRDGRWTTVRMHVLITGVHTGIDHDNGMTLDNQRHNLRVATAAQNAANARVKPHSSRYKGVAWNRRDNRWHARIMVGGKLRHLGYFTDETVAARAYNVAACEAQGEFARLNPL